MQIKMQRDEDRKKCKGTKKKNSFAISVSPADSVRSREALFYAVYCQEEGWNHSTRLMLVSR